VKARISSFKFKGQNEDIRKIGEILNVTHVLEGSVRKSGNRVRVAAQLIATEEDFHIWSERFNRELTDVFAVQDEITEVYSEKARFFVTVLGRLDEAVAMYRYIDTVPRMVWL